MSKNIFRNSCDSIAKFAELRNYGITHTWTGCHRNDTPIYYLARTTINVTTAEIELLILERSPFTSSESSLIPPAFFPHLMNVRSIPG